MVQILASENFYSLASRGGGNRIRKEIFGTRSMVMEVETTHAIRVQRRHPLARATPVMTLPFVTEVKDELLSLRVARGESSSVAVPQTLTCIRPVPIERG